MAFINDKIVKMELAKERTLQWTTRLRLDCIQLMDESNVLEILPIFTFLGAKVRKCSEHNIQMCIWHTIFIFRQILPHIMLNLKALILITMILHNYQMWCKFLEFIHPVGKYWGWNDNKMGALYGGNCGFVIIDFVVRDCIIVVRVQCDSCFIKKVDTFITGRNFVIVNRYCIISSSAPSILIVQPC